MEVNACLAVVVVFVEKASNKESNLSLEYGNRILQNKNWPIFHVPDKKLAITEGLTVQYKLQLGCLCQITRSEEREWEWG